MEIAVKWYMDHRSGPYSWCFCRRRVGTIDPLFALLFHPLFDSSVPHCFWFFPVRSWLLPRRSLRMPRHQNPEKRLTIRFFHIIMLKVFYGVQTSQIILCLYLRHVGNTGNKNVIQQHGGGKNMGTNILPLCAGMHVQMKKNHPCGCATFLILRAGADVRARCTNCGRELMMGRVKFEKAVKRILDTPRQTSENSSHVPTEMPPDNDTSEETSL